MRAMSGGILDATKPLYWAFTALITLVLLYVGIYYEMPL